MNLSKPASTLLRRLDVAALGALYRSERPLAAREVHRLGGEGSFEGVRLTLLRLATTGVVLADERTAGTFYALNRKHVAYPAVDALFTLRNSVIARAREAVETWDSTASHVSFFGSFARQDGDESSDIDVLVIFPDDIYGREDVWSSPVSDLEGSIGQWTGNQATALTMSIREVRAMASGKRASRLWRSLLADNVLVFGRDLAVLAR